MAINYLDYIDRVNTNTGSKRRFLVSGEDETVRQLIAENIVASAYNEGKTLFIINNTRGFDAINTSFGNYRVVNALDSNINLCDQLLNIDSLKGMIRFKSILADLNFDSSQILHAVKYLEFVKRIQQYLNKPTVLTVDILMEYSGMLLVDRKLKHLLSKGIIDNINYNHLHEVYSEVSAAGAELENHLALLGQFLSGISITPDMCVNIDYAELSDVSLQHMITRLLVSYIKQNTGCSSLLILDDGNGDRSFITTLINNIPVNSDVNMISKDAFSLSEDIQNTVIGAFPIRIYTRHDNMKSCAKIEELCGQVDVVKYSRNVTYDRRWKNNSAWDMILGTNRSDSVISNVPTKESIYRKEQINTLYNATGIIDCGGNKVLYSFT